MEISKHLLKVVEKNHTSLGKHPSFPPVDEDKFVSSRLKSYFNSITDGMEDKDPESMKNELGHLITKCRQLESKHIQALSEACAKFLTEIFDIPEGSVEFELNLGEMADISSQRRLSEENDDYTFETIEDMHSLTDEVYKRRMLNALCCGVATQYANSVKQYASAICDIDPELLPLYGKIMKNNHILLFTEKDTLDEDMKTAPGAVNVYVSDADRVVKIKAEGLIFPVLVYESVKGLMELSISHGLPDKMDAAQYVISRSDFSLAEPWDTRLGCMLWNIINKKSEDGKGRLAGLEPYFLLELSSLPCKEFNESLQNMFANTRKGQECLEEIISKIQDECERDEFDDFMQSKNSEGESLTDGVDYFEPEDLLNEIKNPMMP